MICPRFILIGGVALPNVNNERLRIIALRYLLKIQLVVQSARALRSFGGCGQCCFN